MAITKKTVVRFRFENSNGKIYDVRINLDTGDGVARLHGDVWKSSPMHDATETSIDVDDASLSAWQAYDVSRMCYASVYNTSQSLNDILNAS